MVLSFSFRLLSLTHHPLYTMAEQQIQQAPVLAELGNHDIGARGDEPLAFPGIDALAANLVAGDGDGDAAGAFDLLDLDEAVAEAEQLFAAQVVLAQDALDDDLLG